MIKYKIELKADPNVANNHGYGTPNSSRIAVINGGHSFIKNI